MAQIKNLNVSGTLPSSVLELLADLPINVDRRTAAGLVTKYLFPVSYRSLEAWPLPTRNVNGRAIVATSTLFEIAYAKLQAAPLVVGGRRSVHASPRA